MLSNIRKNNILPKIGKFDKVLILGAKGNLGSQMFRVLGNEYRLLALDRDEIDITKKEQVLRRINQEKPHIIINAAAYNAVDKCEEDENEFKLAKAINGSAVGYLAEAALANDSLLVHFSTDYVFPGDNKKGYPEDHALNPVNKYSHTKHLGEEEILKRKASGLKFYLIRTSKLFGPQGESELAKPSFFDIMLELGSQKRELKVVDEEKSCFTYTPDLAQAVKELIESGRDYGIYHIVNSGPVTWYEAARELFKIVRIKIKLVPVLGRDFPRPAARPKYSVLKNTKLRPMRHYRKALKEYVAWKNKSG